MSRTSHCELDLAYASHDVLVPAPTALLITRDAETSSSDNLRAYPWGRGERNSIPVSARVILESKADPVEVAK